MKILFIAILSMSLLSCIEERQPIQQRIQLPKLFERKYKPGWEFCVRRSRIKAKQQAIEQGRTVYFLIADTLDLTAQVDYLDFIQTQIGDTADSGWVPRREWFVTK